MLKKKTIKELLLRNSTPVILSEYGDPALKVVEKLVNKYDYYVSARNFPRPFANPYGLEGYKTISFEIYEQLAVIPDKFFVPTGGGDSIYGVWKGFREIYQAGIVRKHPEMYACQTKLGGDSLVKILQVQIQKCSNSGFRKQQGNINPSKAVRRPWVNGLSTSQKAEHILLVKEKSTTPCKLLEIMDCVSTPHLRSIFGRSIKMQKGKKIKKI